MVTKADIIREIKRKDSELGSFWKDGNYRYGVKFYYGKLEKYNKKKLGKILESLKKVM
jgi:hypothetical protein